MLCLKDVVLKVGAGKPAFFLSAELPKQALI